MIDIGSLGGMVSAARGINNAGQIVGYSYLPGDKVTHGFLYWKGKMVDLNTLLDSSGAGWVVDGAGAINDAGQIVAYAHEAKTGRHHGVLLTPSPGSPGEK